MRVQGFVKERAHPEPGSIPDLLQMFEHELRFYREVAADVGLRVPECYGAEQSRHGFRLVLEDLSSWREGGDPLCVARMLSQMHRRWEGKAERRWPWLRRSGRAADVISDLYARVWSEMEERQDLSPSARQFGSSLARRVTALERDEALTARPTLIHGDASLRNTRTAPDGVVAFVDWEDVRSASGLVDLAWLLVSSVEPGQWPDVTAAYGTDGEELATVMAAAGVQGVFSLSHHQEGSEVAAGWVRRLEAAAALA